MTLRTAVVGTGFWARKALLPGAKSVKGLQVVACVSRDPQRARGFAGEWGISEVFDSVDSLLGALPGLDLLIIATPDHLHAPAVELALNAGVAVYCEKPLTNDAATARHLAEVAEQVRLPNTVGYSFRYSPAIQALWRDLRSGRLGEPWLIELFEHNPQFHPRTGKQMNWKGDPRSAGGGALFEYGSHIIDLAQWLIGPIREVVASSTRVLSGALLDDIATLQLRFDQPTIGTLVSSWVLSGTFPGIRIRLHGSEQLAEVQLDEWVPGGQTYRLLSPDGQVSGTPDLEPLDHVMWGYAGRHLAEFVDVLHGAAAGATLPTFRDGLLTQGVLESALASTKCWQTVPTQ
jgi:1,5-anhydro-D-fructose reductase (1,5-anhydro-D-mannitol-forming)